MAGTRDVASSINSSNVNQLKVAWQMPLTAKAGIFGNYANNAVVVDGVAYIQDLASGVYAIKLDTGKVLWHTQYHSANEGPDGVNVVGGKVYGATATNAFALSAATGEQLWSKKLTRNAGEGIDMAPAVHDGTVYVSTVPGNAKAFYSGDGVAVLWAMDASTGKMKWKWNEVPYSLWGNKKVNSGGGQWQPPTFDSAGHLYLEVANPAPFVTDKGYPGKKVYPNGTSHPGDNLYTDSVVELNPATGKVMWHYQLTPHDIHDWDLNNQALISQNSGKEVIVSAGKGGIAIANDAQTGKLLWKTPVGKHNGHDDDGVLAEKGKAPKPPYTQFPGTLGGVETPYASDGTTDYFPVNNYPNEPINQVKGKTVPFTSAKGLIVAIDQTTGKIKWQHNFPSTPYGSATVTNDLVFTTTFDGTVWALNKSTGAVVWHNKLPAGTNAGVAIDGDYLLVGAGYPSGKGQKATFVAYRLGGGSSSGASTATSTGTSTSAATSTTVEHRRIQRRLLDGGEPEGGSEGVRVHLRLLPHAGGGRVDRHRRAQPRPAQAQRCAGRQAGHQRRRRDAGVREHALGHADPVGGQVRLDRGRQAGQGRGQVQRRWRRAVTIATDGVRDEPWLAPGAASPCFVSRFLETASDRHHLEGASVDI